MKVAFLTGGFPSKENPIHGIFNYRAVKGIQTFAEIEVIRIRIWRPLKKIINTYLYDNITIHEIFIPLIPYSKKSLPKNIVLLKEIGWLYIGKRLKEFNIIHSVGVSLMGIVSSFWAKELQIPHVTQIIGSDLIFQMPLLKKKPYVREWDKWIHGVSANTLHLKRLFLNYYPNVPNVEVIYRGTDLSHFNPKGNYLKNIGNLKGVKFLFVGGFPKYKDIPYGDNLKGGRTLLEAWEIVDREMDNISEKPYLLIGGPGTESGWIMKWKSKLRFREHVLILGKIYAFQIADVYRSADVLLLPSFSEGMPNAAVEASACGIPVFASFVDGVPELIADGYNGLLLPPGDPEKWAKIIIKYSKRISEIREMGKRAREVVEHKFSHHNFIKGIRDLYHKAIETYNKRYRRTS